MSTLTASFIAGARHAVKSVLRRPAFTLINSMTLGLALGASVLAFAVLYGYLFRPLPYNAANRLLVLRQRMVKLGENAPLVSVPFYRTLKQHREFRDAGLLAITDGAAVTVNDRHEFDRLSQVTPSTFTLLGVKPVLGRTLSEASSKPGGPHEVVISYDFWQNEFGGSPNVLRRTLNVGDTTMRVVGVMPKRFVFPFPQNALWTPLVITPARAKDAVRLSYVMLSRMPTGWTRARLNALLHTIRDRELRSPAFPASLKKGGYVVDAIPYREMLLSYAGGAATIWGLFGFTLLLLLLTTLNSANLALAHQRERLGELSLRQVLGAGRAAVARMTLLEFLPILLLMSMIAAGLSVYCIGLLHAYRLPSPYMPFQIRFGAPTITYLVVAAAVVALCVTGSALGASLLSRPSVSRLQDLARHASVGRVVRSAQRMSAATQIGIAVVLIICSVLLGRSLIALLNQPLHFKSRHLAVASVLLPKTTSVPEFWRRAAAAFRNLPGAQSAALSHMSPFGSGYNTDAFYPTGKSGERTLAWNPTVSADFFQTMGTHLLAGQSFDRTDERRGSRNVIVSAALARAFYGKTDVVGETLHGDRRIIGVAPTLPWRLDPAADHNGYTVYSPIAPDQGHYVYIFIRSNAGPAVLIPAIRRAIAAAAPDAAIYRIYTFAHIMQQVSLNREAFTWLVVGFGVLALLIAVFGVYAIVAYDTRLRLFEFAIRQVVGASRRRVLALAWKEMALLVLAGGSAGLVLSYAIARGLSSLIYGVSLLDPAAYLGSVALIAASVLVAATMPVWRATRVDPGEIMRE